MPSRKILLCLSAFGLIAFALVAMAAPARASDWKYGCKGALPVFNESEAIFFNRELLALLPKGWLKGPLRDFALRDAVDEVVVLAKATNENSGLAPTMVFTLLDHPDQKLTLTETSSKTIADVRDKALGPRLSQTTTYKKVYHYVSDFGYLGPLDVKMDCMNYELSAPLR